MCCPSFEPRPNRVGDLIQIEVLAHPVPNHRPGLTPNASCRISLREQGNGVVEPQELDERPWISSRVFAPSSHRLETGLHSA
jgi:hypothetical protein